MNETYICIYIMSYMKETELNSGRMVLSNKAANLDLHLDIPYEQARHEMAKLMLRTGKMPDVVGKNDGTDSTMYTIHAFL